MQDLKQINFQMNTPCESLKDFVQTIWFAHNLDNTKNLPFKILNDCASTIVLNFGDEVICEQGDEKVNLADGISARGASRELLKMKFSSKIYCIGIHFYPATGHHFFDVSMDMIANKFIKTTVESFSRGNDLYKDVQELILIGGSRPEIIKLIESHLSQILKESKSSPQPVLINILKAIHIDHDISINSLSDLFEISVRDIQRLFKTYIGVSPKVYMRLNKIRNVKNKIANNEFESLTQLSMDNGYFDQAHFIRDFKAFMEETPKKYHKLKNKS